MGTYLKRKLKKLVIETKFTPDHRGVNVTMFKPYDLALHVIIDRSHGFIAPRPLYTGPLCPTLE
jgi:hypothetical protein